MAAQYNDVITEVLDGCLPLRQFTRHLRPSDPWFDAECRQAKRVTRRLEQAHAAAHRRATSARRTTSAQIPACPNPVVVVAVAKEAAAKAAWINQRRLYRQLRHRKCSEFWRAKVEADQADPRRLWKTVDTLLGRGSVPENDAIDVETFSRFFADKVEGIRKSTADARRPPLAVSDQVRRSTLSHHPRWMSSSKQSKRSPTRHHPSTRFRPRF